MKRRDLAAKMVRPAVCRAGISMLLKKMFEGWSARTVLLLSIALLPSCAGSTKVPSAAEARDRYVAAIQKGDAEKLRSMMTERARSEYSLDEVEGFLKRDRVELSEFADGLRRAVSQKGEATVYLRGGREAALGLRDGRFWVKSAGLVPESPRTPEDAANYLRQAVEARDYSRIERVLTDEARADFVRAFESLGESLAELDTAVVRVREDRATIEFLDGRVVTLRRAGSAWKVESFE